MVQGDWAMAGWVVSYDEVKRAIPNFNAYKFWGRMAFFSLSYKRA
jgi:hypothetical protein